MYPLSLAALSPATPQLALQQDIPALLSQGNVPGMSIAVIRGGKVFWHNNFGVKNSKSAELVDDHTVFEPLP
jgi:CubicO group peptidase (beta-lactamase class C family)